MANTDRPNGFRPVKHIYSPTKYEVAGSQTISKGDAVIKDANGQIAIYSGGASISGVASTSVENSVAGAEIFVHDHPDQEFEGQCAGTGSLNDLTDTATATNAFDITGTTGIMEIDESASTNDLIQVLALGRDPKTGDVSEVGANTRFYFKFVKTAHQCSA
jgi:hypothetical protein